MFAFGITSEFHPINPGFTRPHRFTEKEVRHARPS